ncbi:hypothetical protein AVEN_164375-1 [Araneus ventricosus]|uniref:Uncharacterized protein n=1 Tax=Araneus ventricosus TaxID=182803 RepID=A0A4Y2GGZ0_ARAVE|nr:hypothetical protein AVEN_164375-1 [Araneus ventricosus]
MRPSSPRFAFWIWERCHSISFWPSYQIFQAPDVDAPKLLALLVMDKYPPERQRIHSSIMFMKGVPIKYLSVGSSDKGHSDLELCKHCLNLVMFD